MSHTVELENGWKTVEVSTGWGGKFQQTEKLEVQFNFYTGTNGKVNCFLYIDESSGDQTRIDLGPFLPTNVKPAEAPVLNQEVLQRAISEVPALRKTVDEALAALRRISNS